MIKFFLLNLLLFYSKFALRFKQKKENAKKYACLKTLLD